MGLFSGNTQKFSKGDVLFLQGDGSRTIYYLTSGSVEILAADDDYNGLDQTLVLSHSRRVSVVTEKTFLAPLPGKSVRALSDCTADKYPISDEGFTKYATEDPAVTINMLLHLFRSLELSYADINKYQKLFQPLARLIDNLSVIHKELSARELPAHLQSRLDDIYDNFKSSGGLPGVVDARFLISDFSKKLGTSYELPGESLEELFNKELYEFFKKFLRMNKNVFAHVIKSDPTIPVFMYDTVTEKFVKVLNKIKESGDIIEARMETAFGRADSWSETLAAGALRDWMLSGRITPDFTKQFISVVMKLYAMYDELTGRSSAEKYPGLNRLKSFFVQSQQTAQAAVPPVQQQRIQPAQYNNQPGVTINNRVPDPNILRLYTNSLQQIFEFAVWGQEQQKTLIKGLADWKKLPDPMNPESDARKLRRLIARNYWDLYHTVFIRSKSVKQLPAPVKLMLRFGFIDESLADREQIMALHEYMNDSYEASYLPILEEQQFLTKVYNQEEPPSMTEMGQSYEAYLREMSKTSSRKGPDPMSELNDPVKQVHFEINNRINTTSTVCSGTISTAFPVFNNFMIKGNLDHYYLPKKKIETIMKDLVHADYSAFYRETVLKMDDAREVIQEEVLPYIIQLPTFGTKAMMWQEMVGINKRSRARIVIPSLFMGDVVKNLAHSIAVFRWELLKTTLGGMWADPVEGGLTGTYQDYVQFFRKNSKLSIEAKDRIKERLMSLRNNTRELFAEDYILWVLFERNGIMKMNGVTRDMFYRFIPFKRDIREKLEKMPAFTESAMRFKNIRSRGVTEYERKFKKYMDANGALKPELQKFMLFLQM